MRVRSKACINWLTPLDFLKKLGNFDLDPCAMVNQPWRTATVQYTIYDQGLYQNWVGRVWLNPPFGPNVKKWVKKLSEHGNGLALLIAGTDKKYFQKYVWDKADGIFFLADKITFWTMEGIPGKATFYLPLVLVAYGRNNVEAICASGIRGNLIENHLRLGENHD